MKDSSGYIYTVSSLTKELKSIIEEAYPFIWVTGEISNCALPSSGHIYFSLKDNDSLINCVMFRNQKKRLAFNPENGMKITGIGRLSLYEPRGSYQLIFEHMETGGTGDLQISFEKLKKKLALEGLFDEEHKKKLPFIPSQIAIITSPAGAVIKDIINVSQRRFPGIPLKLIPVKVQGEGAAFEIKSAIELVNKMAGLPRKVCKADHQVNSVFTVQSDSDNASTNELVLDETMSDIVIIIARGGGSLEDLSPFNSEVVARAVFESELPVISAVGHETDFTICDFVADLRAPTPSAAAEIALPDKKSLQKSVHVLEERLYDAFQSRLGIFRKQVKNLYARLKNPLYKIHDMRFRSEDLEQRLIGKIIEILKHQHEKLDWFNHALYANSPQKNFESLRQRTHQLGKELKRAVLHTIENYKGMVVASSVKLEALSPMGVLKRGYSITRCIDTGKILMNAADTAKGENVEVILSMGKLVCHVNEAISHEKIQ